MKYPHDIVGILRAVHGIKCSQRIAAMSHWNNDSWKHRGKRHHWVHTLTISGHFQHVHGHIPSFSWFATRVYLWIQSWRLETQNYLCFYRLGTILFAEAALCQLPRHHWMKLRFIKTCSCLDDCFWHDACSLSGSYPSDIGQSWKKPQY